MSPKNRKRKGNRGRPVVFMTILLGIVSLSVGLFLILSAKKVSQATRVTGQPYIEVDSTMLDYGQVKLGSVVNATIRVTNTGDQPLRFSEKPYVELIEGC